DFRGGSVLCCGENITFHQVAKFSVPLQSSMARIFCSSVNMFHLLMSPGNRPHPHNGQTSWR
ncbi:hypothetical protein OHF33_24770, partial [Escherichia coli]